MSNKVLMVDYGTLVDALTPLHRGPSSWATTDERDLDQERSATCRAIAIIIVGGKRGYGYNKTFHRLLNGLIADEPIGTIVLNLLALYGTESPQLSEH